LDANPDSLFVLTRSDPNCLGSKPLLPTNPSTLLVVCKIAKLFHNQSIPVVRQIVLDR